ncbi:uncharacterized protein N7487_012196 [Penicillium crustosum]|uniref:uncharacterized protein n=1 Tax=Penicillium crustosum TaxID=36656 RepID=UPI00238E8B43|nr:uncharacterized protein N7487_012196 [Penicillium crustosum]KAJ5394555.1 hypothetical protein N7487_012196 [Penicillium crustosum]
MTPKTDVDSDSGYGLYKHYRTGTDLNSASAVALSPDLAEELAELYFQNNQAGFPYLFHQATFMEDVRMGTIPLILLYGVIGLSARFSQHAILREINPWDRGGPYAKEAERLLDLHNLSLTTIQACMLLALNFAIEGESETECIYFAIASRMGMILDLPNAAGKTPYELELNRRVWWSIVTTDTWSSANLCLPRAIKLQDDILLPVDEVTFARMSPKTPFPIDPYDGRQSSPTPEPSLSALAHLAQLNKLLYEIYRLNATIIDENLGIAAAEEKGFGHIFSTIHINYNHAAQLLFYQFLYASQVASEGCSLGPAEAYARRCKQHAAALCDQVYNAREEYGVDIRYSIISHILVMASTVQIHSLLFSLDDDEIALAKVRLERNFETITRLHTYWPNVSASFSRLRAFHRACLKSMHTSFRLDRWMLRFMLEFSRSIEDKDEETVACSEDSKPFDQLRYLLER